MLYLAIPAHNEVATIGVLLWRLRTVLAEFPREYEVVVYDDGSTDETADVAEQYMHAMPVTVLRGVTPIGYAGAVNALSRHVAGHTRYPRRDAMLLLQGDFTDPPGIVPEFARRFEGGADLVVGERTTVVDAPRPVRRLFTAAGWAMKPFVRVEGVSDLTGSMRLVRISALRDLIRTVGDGAVCEGDSWTANADLLLKLMPHARRVESVPVEPTYGVRTRDTRRVTVRDALAALRWAWRARGRRAVPTTAPESAPDSNARTARSAPSGRRRDEPEVTADRLRERSRERDRLRGESEPAAPRREDRSTRERDNARPARTEEQKAQRRQELRGDPLPAKREQRKEAPGQSPSASSGGETRQPRPPRPPRPPREDRPPRGGRSAPSSADAELVLDDPFAGPPGRSSSVTRSAPASPIDGNSAPPVEHTGAPVPDVPVPQTAGFEREADAPIAQDADDETISETEPAEDAQHDEASDGAPESAGGGERKRRRNRRSRRRKSRTHGEDGAARPDAALDAESSAADAPVQDDSPYASEQDSTDEELGDADDGDALDATDGAPPDANDSDSVARARRRGRRGRRGGSRRSRGRGRDRTNDANTGSGATDPSPPPPSTGESE